MSKLDGKKALIWAVLAGCCVATSASAAVSFEGGVYLQNFNLLYGVARTGTSQFSWTNDTFTVDTGAADSGTTATLAGWYAYASGGASVAAGSSALKVNRTTGFTSPVPLYLWRSSNTATDVAFGSMNFDGNSSGIGSGYISYGFAITNTSTKTYSSISLDYGAEIWNSNTQIGNDALTVSFSKGATGVGDADGTWTAMPELTTNLGGSTTDGTNSYTITQPTPGTYAVEGGWAPGETIFVRWKDVNRSGSDRGTGIDNVAFTAWTSTMSIVPMTANDGSANLITMEGDTGNFVTKFFDVPAGEGTAGGVQIYYPVAPAVTRVTYIALDLEGPADQIALALAEMGATTDVLGLFGPGFDGMVSLTGFQANYYKFNYDLSAFPGVTLARLAVVPEPGAVSLLGVAALGLMARRRRV